MTSATKFVVVEMPVDKSNSKLISFLESNDYTDIFCLRSLTAHHSVQKYIEDQLKKKECVQCKQSDQSNPALLIVKPFGTVNQGQSRQSVSAAEERTFKTEIINDEADTEQPSGMKNLNPKAAPSKGTNTDVRQKYIKTEPGIGYISTAHLLTSTIKNTLEEQETTNNAENADVTRSHAISTTPIPKNSVKLLEPRAIDIDILECSENTAEQVANVQSPLVFWLKRRTSNQSKGEPIFANTSNTAENGSPLVEVHKQPSDQNALASTTYTVNDNLDGYQIISIDDSGSENSEELAQSDLNSSDHQEFAENNGEQAEVSTSPNIEPNRRRSNGNEMLRNSKEKTKKSNTGGGSSSSKIGNSIPKIAEKAPVKCMVCLKDVYLKKKGRHDRDSLLAHAKIHADIKRYQCIAKGCDYSSVNNTRINIHMKFKHNITGTGKDMLLVINNDLRKSWVKSFERCYPTLDAELVALKRSRLMRTVFQDHAISQVMEKCMVCSAGVNLQTMGRNALDRLLAHAKNHADIKQFHCIVKDCDYSSVCGSTAAKHIKSAHNVEGTAQSKISEELKNAWIVSFQRCYPTLKIELENLKQAKHMNGKFTHPRSLKDTEKCTVCSARIKNKKTQNGKVMSSSAYCFEHAKTHCDKKQYWCSVKGCGYSGGSTTSTAEHIKREHGTEDKPHNANPMTTKTFSAHDNLPTIIPYIKDHLAERQCFNCKPAEKVFPSRKAVKAIIKVVKIDSEPTTDQYCSRLSADVTSTEKQAPVKAEPIYELPDETTNQVDHKVSIKTELIASESPAHMQPTENIATTEKGNRIKTENADITPTFVAFPVDTDKCEKPREPDQISTNNNDKSDDTVGEVENVSAPPIIWLKRKNRKQSNGEPIFPKKITTEENGTQLGKHDIECNNQDNSDDLASKNTLLQPEIISTDHTECDVEISTQVGRVPASSTNLPKRKMLTRSNGNPLLRKALTKGTTTKTNKVISSLDVSKRNESRSENKETDGPVKCMVCFSDVNLKIRGRNDRESLLCHAKRHADMKRYHCNAEGCNHSGVCRKRMAQHMKSHHNITGSGKDMLNVDLRKSWMKSFERCYPKLKDEHVALKRRKTMSAAFHEGPSPQDIEKCMVCLKDVNLEVQGRTVLDLLLAHAKGHAKVKQFHCTAEGCDYSNLTTTKVSQHMKSTHNSKGIPKNVMSNELRKAWLMSFERCYPTRKDKLSDLKQSKKMDGICSDPQLLKITEEYLCKRLMKTKKKGDKLIIDNANMFLHAKTHCDRKQFSCPKNGCLYSSSQRIPMKMHIKKEHGTDDQPLDSCDELKETWQKMFKRCFPSFKKN